MTDQTVSERNRASGEASREAWLQQRHNETQDLIEEYEQLRNTDHPRNLAKRMGYPQPASLARRFYRYGRLDLAQGLWYDPT
jgi:hypothetical protein